MLQVWLLTLVVSSVVGTREKPPQCKLTGAGSFMEGIMDAKEAHLEVEDKLEDVPGSFTEGVMDAKKAHLDVQDNSEDAMAAHHGDVQVEENLEDAMASREEHLRVQENLEDAMASREEHLRVQDMTKKAVTIHRGEGVDAPKLQGVGTHDKEKTVNSADVADETTVLNQSRTRKLNQSHASYASQSRSSKLNQSFVDLNQSCTLNQSRTSELNKSHASELKHSLTVEDIMIHNLNLHGEDVIEKAEEEDANMVEDAMIDDINIDEKEIAQGAEEDDENMVEDVDHSKHTGVDSLRSPTNECIGELTDAAKREAETQRVSIWGTQAAESNCWFSYLGPAGELRWYGLAKDANDQYVPWCTQFIWVHSRGCIQSSSRTCKCDEDPVKIEELKVVELESLKQQLHKLGMPTDDMDLKIEAAKEGWERIKKREKEKKQEKEKEKKSKKEKEKEKRTKKEKVREKEKAKKKEKERKKRRGRRS